MLNVVVHLTITAGREDEFKELAARMSKITNEEDEGCITYQFLQEVDNPREFVIYEQWRDQPALDSHVAHLHATFGPPAPGEVIPAAIGNFFEKMAGTRYDAIDW